MSNLFMCGRGKASREAKSLQIKLIDPFRDSGYLITTLDVIITTIEQRLAVIPVRIVVIIDTAVIGGPGRGLLQLWRYHRRAEFGLQFVVFRTAGQSSSEFIEALRSVGAPVDVIEQNSRYDLRGIRELERRVRAGCGDLLIQSHNYKSHLLAWWLSFRLGAPWLAFAHGWTAENQRARVYHFLDRVLLPRADAVVAVSPPLAERIAGWRGGNRVSCIENAIDRSDWLKTTTPDRAQSGGDVICVGRLSAEKGQGILIRAWAEVCQGLPSGEQRLVLVGDGPDLGSLRDLARSLGIEDRVVFAGYTSQLSVYYRDAMILVIPSLSEGLPNVLLEALLLRVPVVATAVGAIPSLHSDTEPFLLVPPSDPLALAAAIQRLLGDRLLCEKLVGRGAALIDRRFAAEPRVRRIEALYRSLVPQSCQGARAAPDQLAD